MKPTEHPESDGSVVAQLSLLLTPPQVRNFAAKALTELSRGQASLLYSLENKQWKACADQAHRLKSAMGLLSAQKLVESLDLIESGRVEDFDSPAFRQALTAQYDRLINELSRYLESDLS